RGGSPPLPRAGGVERVRLQREDLRQNLPRVLPLRSRAPEPLEGARRLARRLRARGAGRGGEQVRATETRQRRYRASAWYRHRFRVRRRRGRARSVPPPVPRHRGERDAREANRLCGPRRPPSPRPPLPLPRLLRRSRRGRRVARGVPRARRPGRRRGPRARRERAARRRERRSRSGDAASRGGEADRVGPPPRPRGAGLRRAGFLTDNPGMETATEPAPPRLLHRELSWVGSGARALELAEDDRLPLLERLKFAAIFSQGLDEFFMVRVAGLLELDEADVLGVSADGLTAGQALDAIRDRVSELTARQGKLWKRDLAPALAAAGIDVATIDDCSDREREKLRKFFEREVFPILTPLAVGPGQPFPYVSGLSLSLGVIAVEPETGEERFARVKVPEVLDRFVPAGKRLVPLESV